VSAGLAFALPDAAATERAGRVLAPCVTGGDAIALVGELGAGKTTLVAGLCAGLGASGVHSPTFALVHEYSGGRLTVWHVDLYRVESERDVAELGLDELLGDPRGVVVIEWADRFAVMPASHLRVELTHADGGRVLHVAGAGATGRARAAAFGAALAAAGLAPAVRSS
jgi:tRNA threonylcarbamoyladenosine biosynthesis protein TsaE